MRYYVVFVGRKPGVYDYWPDCQTQVHGFPGNSYQGYRSRAEAEHHWNLWMHGLEPHMQIQAVAPVARNNGSFKMFIVGVAIITIIVQAYLLWLK
jgi:viroplasmin and RNaseH domain-containing protein